MHRILSLACVCAAFSLAASAQHPSAPAAAPAAHIMIAPPAGHPVSGARQVTGHAPAPAHASAGVKAGTNSVSARSAAQHSSLSSSSRSHSAHGVTRTGTSTAVSTAEDEFGSQYISDSYGVPGLGFDYVHFAAVHPNGVNNHNRYNRGYLLPFLGGSIFVPYPYSYEEQPAAAQPEAEATGTETAENAEDVPEEVPPAEPVVRERRATSEPEQSLEFVFVRRDGTVFFAVAYAWDGENLQYVTKEGISRVVPQNTLDLDATREFNEKRGVTVRTPA